MEQRRWRCVVCRRAVTCSGEAPLPRPLVSPTAAAMLCSALLLCSSMTPHQLSSTACTTVSHTDHITSTSDHHQWFALSLLFLTSLPAPAPLLRCAAPLSALRCARLRLLDTPRPISLHLSPHRLIASFLSIHRPS